MMYRLYKAILQLCALFCCTLSILQAAVDVPVGRDLQADGQIADERQLPILLAFTAIDCGYCELLEEDFLEPMLLGGDYEDRIIIRKVVLDNGSQLTDFSGRQRAATELSDRYKVFVTPTILFVDSNGREMAGRMLGINTPELFGSYLNDCIETAWLNVRGLDVPNRPASCLENVLQ
jgi:thioredoxin-related protein